MFLPPFGDSHSPVVGVVVDEFRNLVVFAVNIEGGQWA